MNEATINKNLERVKRLYKKLAKAETVKGQELGLLTFYSFFVTCFNVNAHRSDLLPYEAEDFQALENKVTAKDEWNTYLIYKNLLNTILDGYNYYLERLKGIEKPYFDNIREIYDFSLAEDRQRELDRTPLVVTESQYKRLYDLTIKILDKQKESYYSLFFTVITYFQADIDKAPEAVKNAINSYKQVMFDEDQNLTAYEALCTMKPFKATDKEDMLFLEVFKDHFKDLYTTIEDYLASYGITQDATNNDIFKKRFSYLELYQKGIFGFEDTLKNSIGVAIYVTEGKTKESWSKYQKALNCGVAIINNPSPACIDQNGDYKEPERKTVLKTIDDPASDRKATADELNASINEMYARAKNVYAYNAFLEILQQAYKIDDLTEAFGIDTDGMERLGKYYNDKIKDFSKNLYGDELTIKAKKQAIKEVFEKLDFESQKPKTDNQEPILKLVNKIKFKPEKFLYYFTRSTTLVNMIMTGESIE